MNFDIDDLIRQIEGNKQYFSRLYNLYENGQIIFVQDDTIFPSVVTTNFPIVFNYHIDFTPIKPKMNKEILAYVTILEMKVQQYFNQYFRNIEIKDSENFKEVVYIKIEEDIFSYGFGYARN
jgi:hypothetical protein